MARRGFLIRALLWVLPMAGLPFILQMLQPGDALVSHGHSNQVVFCQASHLGGPRVAMVAMVRDDQLGSVVDSMKEIQNAFDQQLSYDWIFFSDDDLSDTFKETTSNLTGGAMAFYERFSLGQQSGLQQPGNQGSLQFRDEVKPDHFQYVQLQYAQQLAREQRLSGYEWFWKINPGSKFPAKINLDVFAALKEHGMVYGFSTTNRRAAGDKQHVTNMNTRFVGSDTDASVQQHHHSGVGEVHWSLGQMQTANPECRDLDLYERPEDSAARVDTKNTVKFVKSDRIIMFEGEAHRSADAGTLQDDDDSEEAQSWVEIVRDLCTVGSSFEIGWLDLFRGPLYSTLLDIINGDPRYRLNNNDLLNPRGPSPSISQCDELDCLDLDFEDLLDVDGSYNSDHHQPQQAKNNNLAASGPILDGSTTLLNLHGRELSAGESDDRLHSSGVFVILGDPAEELSAVHAKWAAIMDGFDRQEKKVPGLKAGRTSLFVGAAKEKILGRGNTLSTVELPLLEFV